MSYLLGLVLAGLTWYVLPSLAGIFTRAGAVRPNYTGRSIPTGLGVGLVLPAALGLGWFGATGLHRSGLLTGFLLAGLVGLIDDLLGSREVGGLGGHLGRLFRHGELTTGSLKLIVLGLAALLASSDVSLGWYRLPGALLVALSTNGLNLLDLRPGRALKVFFLFALPLGFRAGESFLWAALGPAVAFWPWDLGGRAMLGDAGANPLGFIVGYGLIATASPVVIGLGVLGFGLLHLYSERASISQAIDRIGWLRFLDQLGRFGGTLK